MASKKNSVQIDMPIEYKAPMSKMMKIMKTEGKRMKKKAQLAMASKRMGKY